MKDEIGSNGNGLMKFMRRPEPRLERPFFFYLGQSAYARENRGVDRSPLILYRAGVDLRNTASNINLLKATRFGGRV